jgi:hypothetical protein
MRAVVETARIAGSARFGLAVKISEDGMVSFYRCVYRFRRFESAR